MTKEKTYMALDQYGNAFHDLGPHPRKALLERLGRQHADRMYIDSTSDGPKHVGWIIAGLWLTVYEVIPMREPA